jgi:hypothetical protein
MSSNFNSPDFLKLMIQDTTDSVKSEKRVHPNICIQEVINFHDCVIKKRKCDYVYEKYVKCMAKYEGRRPLLLPPPEGTLAKKLL